MSSIYRKGRDGYYYYQTYVYNPKTGKKDKRIFHSLGTKNQSQAEQKQKEYDSQYEHNFQKRNRFQFPFSIQHVKILVLMVFTALFTLQISNSLFSTKETNKTLYISNEQNNKDYQYSANSDSSLMSSDLDKKSDALKNSKEKESLLSPKIKIEQKIIHIPEYTVERVERLSGAFSQGKIFITVDYNGKSESLRMLCDKLTSDFSEFSNIIICLYDNSTIGRELALGNDLGHDSRQLKDSWLAMYTYNSVEGAYFDDNPGGYIGAY